MVREAPDTQEEAEVCDFRARGAASVPCRALLPHSQTTTPIGPASPLAPPRDSEAPPRPAHTA